MDDSDIIKTEDRQHCLDWINANDDGDIRKNAHDMGVPPLIALTEAGAVSPPWDEAAATIHTRRTVVSFTTLRSSFDLWASLGYLENLLSDYRRIAPRFSFLQLAGEAGIAAGNEYRLTIADPAHLAGLEAACRQMAPGPDGASFNGNRHMDVRVTRAGPWGGETGELAVEALENHALAGASALWLVAHGEAADGSLRITLDAFEISRWAWAPDFLAAFETGRPACIIDWPYLFERLIQEMDGTPDATATPPTFERKVSSGALESDKQISDALQSHPALSAVVRQLHARDQITP